MMAKVVYFLCALASIGCAAMLVRGYRNTRTRLLLWTSLCFVGLALNSAFLFVDLALVPTMDLSGTFWRNLIGALSGSVLLAGLIWELT